MAAGDWHGDGDVIHLDPGGTVSKGDVYELGDGGIGVWLDDGVSGDLVACRVRGEVEIGLTASLGALSALDYLFYSATTNLITRTVTDIPAGLAAADTADSAGTIRVLLNLGALGSA